MLQIKGKTFLLASTGDGVILNRESSVEKRLALPAKFMLNAREGAALVRYTADVIVVDFLRHIDEGLVT